MAHLTDYEEISIYAKKYPSEQNFIKAALAALDCSDSKNAKKEHGIGLIRESNGLKKLVLKMLPNF